MSAGQATTPSAIETLVAPPDPPCARIADFDPGRFTNPTRIDNAWLPLSPGTQWVLEGTANRGAGQAAHRVVFTVTDLTKVINGVRTVVVWDVDQSAGQVAEAELAFWAQDDERNVWYLGEYPEEYERGRFAGAPNAWLAGVDEAEAGVLMPAQPETRTSEYLQGWAPSIEFLDCARTIGTGQRVCVPTACYDSVLTIQERSPLESGSATQGKYYAPGVGNIMVDEQGDPEAETLVLTSVAKLSPAALVEARVEALKLERHAYEVSDVYRGTALAEAPAPPAPPPPPTAAAASPSPPAAAAPPAASVQRSGAKPRPALPRASKAVLTIRRSGRRVLVILKGPLVLPSTIARTQGCRGTVLITVKRGRRAIARQSLPVGSNCRYRGRLAISRAKLRGTRVLTVILRFRGNDALGTVERSYRVRAR